MSKTQKASFWIITLITLAGTSAILSFLVPLAPTLTQRASSRLLRDGWKSTGDTAVTDYTLAGSLNPGNHQAYLGLATIDYQLGHPANSLKALDRAGQGTAVSELSVEANLEVGDFQGAAIAAKPLETTGNSDPDLHLAALAEAAAGNNSTALSIASRLSSPEAAQSALRAGTDKTALAQELYVSGLLNASETVLNQLPEGYERNLLLARLLYNSGDKAKLALAANLVQTASFLNPSSLTAHQLLAVIYRSENLGTKASSEDSLTSKISSGKP